MNALHSLVPSWLHRKDDDMPDEMPPLPTIATLPKAPEFTDDDRKKLIMSQAAGFVEEYKRDREESKRRFDELQVQYTELVLAHESEKKKSIFLELENASLRNDIQTLQSDVERYRDFMSKVKQILDLFGVKAPEKKPRKPKKSSVTIEAVTPDDLP